jgi:hypothetical protein
MTMRKLPTLGAGRACRNAPPLPQRAMADTILSKKMRAFDGEVALAVVQLYLVRMLQTTPRRGEND